MRPLGPVIFIVSFLISQAACARDANVGDTKLSVSPPAGFCELDTSKTVDKTWLGSATNLLQASGVFLIAAFPDCGALQKARQSNQFILSKIYISAPSSGIGKSSLKDLADTCKELRTTTYSDEQKAKLSKDVKEFGQKGSSLADSIALGVLEETDGEVCYVATLQKVRLKAGDDPTAMLALFAVTYARNNLLFLYQYTPYVDTTSIPSALANLKIVYSDFPRANKK
jgi:hypothetical protein